MAFLETANIPHRAVSLVAVSGEDKAICQKLNNLGINIIEAPSVQTLQKPVSSHADMLLHHIGGNKIIIAKETQSLSDSLAKYGFEIQVNTDLLGEIYPNDIALNFVQIQKYIIGRIANMSKTLYNIYQNSNYKLIDCRQGYAKCSTAIINENAVITADTSIAKILLKLGIDVLLVPGGGIRLDGYDTGFIGGCCGLIDKSTIAFTGSLEKYFAGDMVLEFLYKHQTKAIYLSDTELVDIGGIIPLKH